MIPRLLLLAAAALALQPADGGAQLFRRPARTLSAFRSERELADFLRSLAPERRRLGKSAPMLADAVVTAPTASMAEAGAAQGRAADESVTNTQHAGVDEGGIVKLHGDHLVILRRGRLFTVRVGARGDDELRPVSAVDAFGPGIDPGGTWYDEMLISGDRVIVIGYSYARGGTEVGLFRLDGAGRLRHEDTYHLRANDYYSSRNYASRLIGTKLVFYSPLYLWSLRRDHPLEVLPAMRRWRDGGTLKDFASIVTARRVYRAPLPLAAEHAPAMHTVTVCDLATREMECEATVVFGPAGRVFYVSPSAVYVWMSDWRRGGGADDARSMVYRMPLDGSAPTAVGVSGTPLDQFSFLESGDEQLNVLVRSAGHGEAMWGAERARGSAALLRLPLSDFGDGTETALASRYRALPTPPGYTVQNRFVGEHLLYGAGSGWGAPRDGGATLFVTRWAGGDDAVTRIEMDHGVDRIEVMGRDAVVIGTDGRDLHFSGVSLRARAPRLAQHYVMEGASQGELRSHGFFYRADADGGGLIGLPVRGEGRPGYEHLTQGSASVTFVRNTGRSFRGIGELRADESRGVNDECRASCVDWYGNARPLFLRGRVFALLGYELVEGRVQGDAIVEARRVHYAPRAWMARGP